MKILITGGSGLLGYRLNIELSKNHEILSLYNSNFGNCKKFNSEKIDIKENHKLESIFNSFKPEIVIHTAAISNPGGSDRLPSKEVFETNVNATQKIAELCEKYSSKLIYTSTDLVYAGYRGTLLQENAKLIPISLYAETKLMGEVKIQNTFDNYIILRTALMYDLRKDKNVNSHFNWMYYQFKNGKTVKLFNDQFRSPLAVFDAARIISELVNRNVKKEIINFGGKQKLTRVELGEILCSLTRFDKNLIQQISMDDIEGFAKVADVSMDVSRLKDLGISPLSTEESIKHLLNEIDEIS